LRTTSSLFIVSLLLTSLTCSAAFKSYEAAVDESVWQFNGNPLNCALIHKIPYFGDAKFEKSAGKGQNLDFKLAYKRHKVNNTQTATVRAIAPAWQPLQSSRLLGQTPLLSGQHLISSKNTASWKLLNELEVGRFPTFSYQEFNDLEDQVSVALSSVGFRLEYDKFLDCLVSLVPYKLDELTKMTIYFGFDRANLKAPDSTKLEALAAYIKYDPSVEVVFIHGHTDNKGSRYYNEKLANRRIQSVKKTLTLEGVEDNRFQITAFGEKKPIASNRTAQGRAKNRRVYIRIAQK